MTTVAFVGKTDIDDEEAAFIEVLGMGAALAGDALITTPAGGAATSMATGYRAAGGQPTFAPNPIPDADIVLFYDDGDLLYRLLTKDPSPLNGDWILLTNRTYLEAFANAALFILTEKGHDFTCSTTTATPATSAAPQRRPAASSTTSSSSA